MADVSELRAVRGMTPKIYARLKPWLCVLPVAEPVMLNANTLLPAQAPLIAMLLPGKPSLADARAVLAARPADGYGSSVRFWQSGPLARIDPPSGVDRQVGVTSRWLALRTQVTLGDGNLTANSAIDPWGGPPPGGSPPPAHGARPRGESQQ